MNTVLSKRDRERFCLNCFYIFQEDEKRTENEISSRNLDYVEFDYYIFDY